MFLITLIQIYLSIKFQVNDTLNFNVTIEDEVNEGPFGRNNVVEVPVSVIVLDENDNEPVFHNVSFHFRSLHFQFSCQ